MLQGISFAKMDYRASGKKTYALAMRSLAVRQQRRRHPGGTCRPPPRRSVGAVPELIILSLVIVTVLLAELADLARLAAMMPSPSEGMALPTSVVMPSLPMP